MLVAKGEPEPKVDQDLSNLRFGLAPYFFKYPERFRIPNSNEAHKTPKERPLPMRKREEIQEMLLTMKRIKLEGKEAFFACVAAGVPMGMKQDPDNRGRVIMEIKVPCAAYLTEDGQIQVFQGPSLTESER